VLRGAHYRQYEVHMNHATGKASQRGCMFASFQSSRYAGLVSHPFLSILACYLVFESGNADHARLTPRIYEWHAVLKPIGSRK
jgi:hypothetical protein